MEPTNHIHPCRPPNRPPRPGRGDDRDLRAGESVQAGPIPPAGHLGQPEDVPRRRPKGLARPGVVRVAWPPRQLERIRAMGRESSVHSPSHSGLLASVAAGRAAVGGGGGGAAVGGSREDQVGAATGVGWSRAVGEGGQG